MRVHSPEEEPSTGNTLTSRRRATEKGDWNKIYQRGKFTPGLQELGFRALANTAGRSRQTNETILGDSW